MGPQPRVLERDDAPMATDVRDAGYPTERSVFEREARRGGVIGTLEDIRTGGGLLVEEEDLAKDLCGDATGGREGIVAGADRAQRTADGGHFSIDEVEGCSVCEGRVWDLL